MKQYKVGDTVYLKAFVANVDKSDPEKTYGVNYVRGMYGVQGWPDNDAIIDELPTAEPVKPVLPKAVADELESAKENCNNFYGFLRDCNSETHPEANQFVFYSCGSSDSRIKILSDAWYIGYTIKPEPTRYNLILGTNPADNCVAFFKNNGSVAIDCCALYSDLDEDAFQFTQKEIDGYNKDGASWVYNSLDLNNLKVEVED